MADEAPDIGFNPPPGIPFWILNLIRQSGGTPTAAPVRPQPSTLEQFSPERLPGAIVQGGLAAGAGALALGRTMADLPEPAVPAQPTRIAATAPVTTGKGAYPFLSPEDVTRGTEPAAPDVLSEEEFQRAQPAGYSRTGPSRAIRLPDGRILFTNRPEYGGEEFTTEEGGRLVRAGQRARPAPVVSGLDPTSATMTALVRASMRASAGEAGQPPPIGRRVPGITPSTSGGALSVIEGTPEQQLEQRLADAMGALSLAGAQQELEKAKMPAAERALLENPQVQRESWLINVFMPRIERAQQKAQVKAHLVSTPGNPDFVADEKQRSVTLRSIQADRDAEVGQIQQLMTVLMGVRPAPI